MIENLKQVAITMDFFVEHGIDSYEAFAEQCTPLPPLSSPGEACGIGTVDCRPCPSGKPDRLLGNQIDTYRKLKAVYDHYKASKDKEKFLRGFGSEIILFKMAARKIKKARFARRPSSEKLKVGLGRLTARKTAL